LAFLGILLLVLWRPIQREVVYQLTLAQEAPSQQVFLELVEHSAAPMSVVERFWATEKIPHRSLAVAYLKEQILTVGEVSESARRLLRQAVLDPDVSVREAALVALKSVRDPLWIPAATVQLQDADPELRVLGLRLLREADPETAVPLAMSVSMDPDRIVSATAETVLQKLTGVDFGVRIRHAMALARMSTDMAASSAELEILEKGVTQRQEWWREHRNDYDSEATSQEPFALASVEPVRLPVRDFELMGVNGVAGRLSDHLGKSVWINFWATWCPSCLKEIPHLIELQRRHPDQLVVIGISLDGVPDAHGHDHGDDGEHGDAHEDEPEGGVEGILAKVRRTVTQRGINYPVLLDPKNEVGQRFNGGELPTNVMIDPEGFMRRRFLGGRTVAAFEAMTLR